ncbi:amino acid ABC transporter substrate-binding protein [Couchioplanes azureus]|uniref:amino acid ABC transporter substrate-binding protein n=1 Tax=Couchioplanes caeruleus TaxID=56438 RepID=UPI001670178D|nr:amino acid ABC transporter substrate-binding protein [Couchioplanes caeruleus]GGQ69845.1 amino acid ABC transporter substrate-binding protein [Couchioplanes caeruleus subsp. azureus]
MTSTDSRLAQVQRRGAVRAGVSTGIRGLSAPDAEGRWQGLDVDTARAVAAAVLGDAEAVEFVPMPPAERMPALASGAIDVLTCNATWTVTRETGHGATFVATTCYDGGAFLVPRAAGVTSPLDLAGRRIGVLGGTSSAASLERYYAPHGLAVDVVPYPDAGDALAGYRDGAVDAYVCDGVVLAAEKTRLADPQAHVVLPDLISKEPMGPAVADGDSHWLKVVRWVVFALIAAEEEGLTAAAARAGDASALLDGQADLGAALGLSKTWLADVIGAVGNYGEVYDRSFGAASGLDVPRGLNDLWTRGGLMYAPPFA